MTLADAVNLFLTAIEGEVAPATHTWYRQRLHSLVAQSGSTPLDQITIDSLRQWRATLLAQRQRWADHPTRPALAGPLSSATLHDSLRAVKRLFRWLVSEGHLTANPTTRLKLATAPKEPPKAISEEDLTRLLIAAAASGARDLALVAFIADTACRCAGAAGARLSELDTNRRTAIVREKGKKARTVFFGPETARALRAWLSVRPTDPTDALFLRLRGGGPLTPIGVYQVFKRLARAAGLQQRFNPHSLRHAYARRALQAGADLATVSEIMGHTDIAVTATFYARWADNELQARKERFSGGLTIPPPAPPAAPPAEPTEKPNNQPTKPNDHPAKPNDQPTKPNDHPAKPSDHH